MPWPWLPRPWTRDRGDRRSVLLAGVAEPPYCRCRRLVWPVVVSCCRNPAGLLRATWRVAVRLDVAAVRRLGCLIRALSHLDHESGGVSRPCHSLLADRPAGPRLERCHADPAITASGASGFSLASIIKESQNVGRRVGVRLWVALRTGDASGRRKPLGYERSSRRMTTDSVSHAKQFCLLRFLPQVNETPENHAPGVRTSRMPNQAL